MSGLLDTYHRRIDYMRISVTDRCDLRCIYCTERTMPRLSHYDILRYEEIKRVVEAAARLGVKSLRITGGEPLVRPNLDELIKLLVQVEGIDDISMTTNGTLLKKHAFKADKYSYITGSDKLKEVLDSIEAAREAQLVPVKINVVVMKGINDDELLDFARKSLYDGWHVRFIERMPLVATGFDNNDIVSVQEMMTAIQQSLGSLEPCLATSGKGPAKYYRLADAQGTIGFIGPVTDCFCSTCNRFRLTADGGLRPCLLENDEIDIKKPLRDGASIDELEELMRQAAALKRERHRLNQDFIAGQRQMWQIGG
jgi:cyclic pyranopterin phosphate synthase